MPLLQYFTFAGAALVTALFLADAYVPKTPAIARAEVDRSIIRIQATQKWPERVDLTAAPTARTF